MGRSLGEVQGTRILSGRAGKFHASAPSSPRFGEIFSSQGVRLKRCFLVAGGALNSHLLLFIMLSFLGESNGLICEKNQALSSEL